MVAPSAPVVSHLLFADDSLLFFRANVASAQEIKEILQIYCKVSGQQVNMENHLFILPKVFLGALREK